MSKLCQQCGSNQMADLCSMRHHADLEQRLADKEAAALEAIRQLQGKLASAEQRAVALQQALDKAHCDGLIVEGRRKNAMDLLNAAEQRAREMREIIRACHVAVGEHEDSDDATLPKAISVLLETYRERAREVAGEMRREAREFEGGQPGSWNETTYRMLIGLASRLSPEPPAPFGDPPEPPSVCAVKACESTDICCDFVSLGDLCAKHCTEHGKPEPPKMRHWMRQGLGTTIYRESADCPGEGWTEMVPVTKESA